MDWIHCNGCFVQPRTNSNPPKFFLTSCGHIFCERCNLTATTNKCRVCEAQYTTTVLSSQLREEVRDFFADPETLLGKCAKVIQYQNSHRERLTAYHRRALPKYESAKREIQKLHEELKNLRKKLHVQEQEIAWYKMQRDRLRAARAAPPTPRSASGNSPFIGGLSSSDTQRSALQNMRNSGMGSSRISMGFTSSTPRLSQDGLSPALSMLPPATPFPGQYRSQHFATPESTPGGDSSFLPESPASSDGRYRHSSQRRHERTPPSREPPTDALKILALAYKNANKHP